MEVSAHFLIIFRMQLNLSITILFLLLQNLRLATYLFINIQTFDIRSNAFLLLIIYYFMRGQET